MTHARKQQISFLKIQRKTYANAYKTYPVKKSEYKFYQAYNATSFLRDGG